jgi:transposase
VTSGATRMTSGGWVRKVKEARAAGAPLEESERLELVRLRTELKDADATVAELGTGGARRKR